MELESTRLKGFFNEINQIATISFHNYDFILHQRFA